MSSSSRATIPPLSGSRAPSLPASPPGAHLVWRRHALIGAALGFVFSLPSISVLEMNDAPWQSLALSVPASMGLSALGFGAIGTLAFAMTHALPRLRAHATFVAALVAAASAVAYALLRGSAEFFHLSSGTKLNVGTLEFVAASWRHIALSTVREYAGTSIVLAALTVTVATGAFLFARRPQLGTVSFLSVSVRGLTSLGVLFGLLQVLVIPGITAHLWLTQTADLSLLTSMAARSAERVELEQEAAKNGVMVPPGAPLSTGELWAAAVARMEGPRPNVVLVMLESVGTSHLGTFGYARDVTPRLDQIAQRSVRFTEARATATHSNYAQMAVLSSLFPRRYSGLDTYQRLDYPRVLWHDFLSAFGYATATHSSQDESWQGMISFQQTETKTHFAHSGTYEGKHINMGAEKVVPDEVTVRRAIEWIGAQKQPFGLYVNLQSTHFPYRIPEGAPKKFFPEILPRGKYHYLHYPKKVLPAIINRYDNALAYVDAQVGRLYDYLEATGRLENTVFIITSDHGELFWDHGMVTHGRSLYDAEARVPLFVHFPARLSPAEVRRPVSTLDVLPTVATLLEAPPHPGFQGTSLLEAADASRPVFMNIQGMKSHDGVVCGSFKLIVDRTTKKSQLFDLSADPGEKRNVASGHAELEGDLRLLLGAQMREQLAYHAPGNETERAARYAPRFASCPTNAFPAPASPATSGLSSARAKMDKMELSVREFF